MPAARYVTNENGFAFSWPAVSVHQFLAERDRAFEADAPSGLIALDISREQRTTYAATTPMVVQHEGLHHDMRTPGFSFD